MRVLVSRPEERAAATAERLSELGHVAVLAPVLAITQTEEPPPAGPFAAAVVTSGNGVASLAQIRRTIGALPVYAVGRRTAEAASAAGFAHVLTGAGTGRDLADLIASTIPPGGAVLHAAGRDRTDEPARSLSEAGYAVRVWECYEACPVHALPHAAVQALRAGTVDAALHYSARTARHLARLACEADLRDQLAAVPHLCLSVDIAAALSAIRPAGVFVADAPTEARLLALLDTDLESFGTGSRPPQSG